MAFFAGKSGSVSISATARPYDTWEIDATSEIVDVTNFTSSGYSENVAGVFQINVSFSGPYDGSEGIAQGDSVAVTFATGGAGPSFVVTNRLSSVKISTATRNKAATIAATGVSTGSHSLSI